ncbi:helix-turn-helix domain-containing protein [Spirillospora sp. NPDC047279]|uniref:TetR/AcrR family transcriptional regulator n=1 Tax=Spirillospora sp. NPDC047279 TaxID=3155478 RepID=UPI0033F5AF5C
MTANATPLDDAGLDDASPAAEPGTRSPRGRLLRGLAASIRERGFRETKVSDIVRHARTSRRTFYEEFATKDECYVALLKAVSTILERRIAEAIDRDAPWRAQVRQGIEAWVGLVASEPELTLSWIRELQGLDPTTARRMQRESMESLITLLVGLSASARADVAPVSRSMALVLLGGLRELTASVVEGGGDVRDITETAVAAATALLAPDTRPR